MQTLLAVKIRMRHKVGKLSSSRCYKCPEHEQQDSDGQQERMAVDDTCDSHDVGAKLPLLLLQQLVIR